MSKDHKPAKKPASPRRKAAGRPVGSKTFARKGIAVPGRCPSCGSTEREGGYSNIRELAHCGTDDHGPYTHTVWKWCVCKKCGKGRTDRFRENRV